MRRWPTVGIDTVMMSARHITWFRPRLVFSWLLMAASAGCVSYRPHPISPDAIAATRTARMLDEVEVGHRITEIAPVRPASPVIWDRLSLFAAATLYNADVAAARAAVDTAAANVGVARQWPNMTLTLTSEYARDPSASSPWLFGGALDIPLDIGGRRATRIATADLAVLSARYDVAETIWSARTALRRAFAERLIADRQILALRALAQIRDRQFAAMERRVASGEASRGELERVRADGADAGRRLDDAQAQRRAANQAIASAIGVPETAVAPLVLEWTGFDDPATAPGGQVNPELRFEAVRSRADVLKVIVAYDQAESDLRGEVAKQFPAISISPGYTWERGLNAAEPKRASPYREMPCCAGAAGFGSIGRQDRKASNGSNWSTPVPLAVHGSCARGSAWAIALY